MRQSSPTWADTDPEHSIVVSTYNRSRSLPTLFAAIAEQEVDRPFELVIVDNGSTDDTWSVLQGLAADAPFPALAARIEENRGPSSGRNAAVELARGAVLVFTDDDCRPSATWLAAIARAEREGPWAALQGRTLPEPAPQRGPWDHTISVTRATGLFETCNIAYRRADVLAAGGFVALENSFLGRGGQPFGGEDTKLGAAIARANEGLPVRFVEEAVVFHAVEPHSYEQWLKSRTGTRLFPAIVREVPELRDELVGRWFLAPWSARLELALLGLLVALATRRPLLGVLTVPYVVFRFGPALRARDRVALVIAVRRAGGDLVALRALWAASVRHRTVVL